MSDHLGKGESRKGARTNRLRRWGLRGAVVLAVAALLALAVILFARWKARQEWESYRAEALARGVKLTWREFIPPEMPDSENYVTGTLFERPLDSLKTEGTAGRSLRVPRPEKDDFKTQTAVERLSRARAGMIEAEWLTEEKTPAEAAQAVLLGMERLRPELNKLRVARARKACRFPQSTRAPPQVEFHNAGIAMDAGLTWTLLMDAHLAVAKPGEAREDFRDAIRIYVALQTEPTLINGLIRLAIFTNVLQAVNDGISAQQWRDEDLQEIAVALAQVDIATDARKSYSSERGFVNDAFESMRRESFWKQIRPDESIDLLDEQPRGWGLFLDISMGRSWREQVTTNRALDQHLENFGAGFLQVYQHRISYDGSQWNQSRAVFNETAKRFVIVEISRRESLAAVALERCRQKRGNFPEALSELVPEFLGAVPMDAMDHQPMKYRRLETGKFLLYSVGANGRDDGGATGKGREVAGSYKAKDWVWNENWK